MGRQNIGDESRRKSILGSSELWGEYGDTGVDSRIYQEVIEGFNRSSIKTDHIVVSVEHARVYLRGMVETAPQKAKIEEFVRQLDGVAEVRNEIYIKI